MAGALRRLTSVSHIATTAENDFDNRSHGLAERLVKVRGNPLTPDLLDMVLDDFRIDVAQGAVTLNAPCLSAPPPSPQTCTTS